MRRWHGNMDLRSHTLLMTKQEYVATYFRYVKPLRVGIPHTRTHTHTHKYSFTHKCTHPLSLTHIHNHTHRFLTCRMPLPLYLPPITRVRCVALCIRACVCACVHACVHACVRACMRACMRACVCVCSCVPVCVCTGVDAHAVCVILSMRLISIRLFA